MKQTLSLLYFFLIQLLSSSEVKVQTGTVFQNSLEGNQFGIETDHEKLNIVESPNSFHLTDGQKVRFKAEIKKEFISFHLWGKPIKVLFIEEIV